MKYTVMHGDKAVIKDKSLLSEAMSKLHWYEIRETDEMENDLKNDKNCSVSYLRQSDQEKNKKIEKLYEMLSCAEKESDRETEAVLRWAIFSLESWKSMQKQKMKRNKIPKKEETMRETLKEWRDEWIATNGTTNELEVVIKDSTADDFAPYTYEGSFASIPISLLEKKVTESARIIDSSMPERIGAYSLLI